MDNDNTHARQIANPRRQVKAAPGLKGGGARALKAAYLLGEAPGCQSRNLSENAEAVSHCPDVPFGREEFHQAYRSDLEANMRLTAEAMPAMMEAIGRLHEDTALVSVRSALPSLVEDNPNSTSPIQAWTSNVLLEHAYVCGHVLPSNALRRAFPSRKPVHSIPEFPNSNYSEEN